MRVKYLIEQLKEYDPDDEIIVAYWDREWFAGQIEPEITDEHWLDIVGDGENVVENMEIGGYLYEAARLVLDKVADDANA
jgi:putative AlgH/UPF0301 family transcriptional regulator